MFVSYLVRVGNVDVLVGRCDVPSDAFAEGNDDLLTFLVERLFQRRSGRDVEQFRDEVARIFGTPR